jgi:hypothetical protein
MIKQKRVQSIVQQTEGNCNPRADVSVPRSSSASNVRVFANREREGSNSSIKGDDAEDAGHKAIEKVQSIVMTGSPKVISKKKAESLDEKEASIKIQSIERGRKARKQVEEMKKEVEEKKQEEAAITIQKVHRGSISRKRAQSIKQDAAEAAAATHIQALLRGHSARKLCKELKKEKTEKTESSIKLQKMYRGHNARKEVKQMREERRSALERDADTDGPKRAVRRAGRKG